MMKGIPKDIWAVAGPSFNDYPAIESALRYPHVQKSLLTKHPETGMYPLEAAVKSHNVSLFDLILSYLEKMQEESKK